MIGQVWDLVILQPVINSLIGLSHYLFDNFGLAIISLTIVVNLLMYPLTMKQLKSTKGMQDLQPKLAELQKKYGKDKQRMAQEQMSLYKESGLNPAGCLLPMLIQMPIWIALFQSIMRLVAVIPENLMGLSRFLYSWPVVYSTLPLQNMFFGLDLSQGNLFMAILVGATMWLQQKMITPTTADPRQQAQSRMMLWMMPIMFAFICVSLPSGLALYWITSNLIRIGLQYYMTGWGALIPAAAKKPVIVRDSKLKKRIAMEGDPKKDAPLGADIVDSTASAATDSSASRPEDEPADRKDLPKRLGQFKDLPRRDKGGHQKGR
ncbi:YidC/Oxa1 family membrane protein insertase [Chloroflexota bacterium]